MQALDLWPLRYLEEPQLDAEMVSPNRIVSIIDNGEMLPVFGIVPWKHHILISSNLPEIGYTAIQKRREEEKKQQMDLHFNQSLALGYHSGSQIS